MNHLDLRQILEVPLGRYEGNNPMLTVSVPKRYRNTPIHEQLKNKSRQLMTHFDLHATFMDILKVRFNSGNFRRKQKKKLKNNKAFSSRTLTSNLILD